MYSKISLVGGDDRTWSQELVVKAIYQNAIDLRRPGQQIITGSFNFKSAWYLQMD